MCGVDNWVELERFCYAKLKWFRTFPELPNGVPSHDTFGRVSSLLDPEEFRRSFVTWVGGLGLVRSGDVVAIDGMTVRRSLDAAKGIPPIHMVNVWAREAGVALGQLATQEKSNEITAIPVLLEQLRIAGCIVTTAAMGCQKAIATAIRGKDAGYCQQLKDNHPKVRDDVVSYFASKIGDSLQATDETYLQTVDGDHGRIEIRRH